MKARVKETGKIVEVIAVGDYINEFGQIIGEYKDANGILYTSYELDFYIEEGITIPDYWTRLEHQYAGMAMQGLMTILPNIGGLKGRTPKDEIVDIATSTSHALVEKLKGKEEK
jgi:hypothetical protein